MRFVYLHGFASSPASDKARFFRARFAEHGVELRAPDLNAPSFRDLTLSRSVGKVRALVPQGERAVVIGSSFGGYTAALFAAAHPERAAALVLMAPAFNMARLLVDRYGEADLAAWRDAGTTLVDHPGFEAPQPLDWGFQADAEALAGRPLEVTCPTLVFHGRQDESVPFGGSEAFVAAQPEARLVPFESGHALTEVTGAMWRETRAFLDSLGLLPRR